jgi:hypothetical protein
MMLSKHRDLEAAKTFFAQAREVVGDRPTRVTTDPQQEAMKQKSGLPRALAVVLLISIGAQVILFVYVGIQRLREMSIPGTDCRGSLYRSEPKLSHQPGHPPHRQPQADYFSII